MRPLVRLAVWRTTTRTQVVVLLLSMLGPQLDAARRTVGGAGGLGKTYMRPGAWCDSALSRDVLPRQPWT